MELHEDVAEMDVLVDISGDVQEMDGLQETARDRADPHRAVQMLHAEEVRQGCTAPFSNNVERVLEFKSVDDVRDVRVPELKQLDELVARRLLDLLVGAARLEHLDRKFVEPHIRRFVDSAKRPLSEYGTDGVRIPGHHARDGQASDGRRELRKDELPRSLCTSLNCCRMLFGDVERLFDLLLGRIDEVRLLHEPVFDANSLGLLGELRGSYVAHQCDSKNRLVRSRVPAVLVQTLAICSRSRMAAVWRLN